MTIGLRSPRRVMVTVQSLGPGPMPIAAPFIVASNAPLEGAGPPVGQPPSTPASRARAAGAGSRSPSLPPGGAGTGSPQRDGTFGRSPPVYQGSSSSRPYQLTISSE